MNKFRQFKDWINSKPIGFEFTRKEMLAITDEATLKETTVDKYKATLIVLEILGVVKQGKYVIRKHIEEDVTLRSLRKKAYPNQFKE